MVCVGLRENIYYNKNVSVFINLIWGVIMEKEIYLDNSATTQLFVQASEKTGKALLACYGNPSSLHKKGFEAEKEVKKARKIIADALNVDTSEIYFCSGGTEANNWAIEGVARKYAKKGRHLITSVIEHPSVLHAFKRLSETGFEVTYLPVNSRGELNIDDLREALREDTILVSIMYVNNEIGVVYPIKEIADVVKAKSAAFLHVDAVQGFGKMDIYPKQWKIDLLSITAHKLHGPKGVGVLYFQKKMDIPSLLVGGSQEGEKRAGTENVPGIIGFGEAVRILEQSKGERARINSFKNILLKGIDTIPGANFNGNPHTNISPIINVWFKGIDRAEVLMHMLEAKGLYVSTGSACHSRKKEPSHVLVAIGAKNEALFGSIRLSFGFLNTEVEAISAITILSETVQELRHI